MTLLSRLADGLGDALLRERSPLPLAVFRIGWSLAMLTMIAHEWTRTALYQRDVFHVPLFVWIEPPSAGTLRSLLQLSSVGAIACLAGLLPRVGAATVVTVLGYLFVSDLLLFRNHVYLGLLLGMLLACSPCGASWSVEALIRRLRRRSRPAAPRVIPAVLLIKLQVLIVYAWSVLNKLNTPYLQGWTLQRELPYSLLRCPLSRWLHDDHGTVLPWVSRLLANDVALACAAWSALLIELALVLGLLYRPARPFVVLLGVVLHLGIFCLMNVATFGALMVSTYVLFCFDAESGAPESLRAS
jgi:hypothetical protein